MSHTIIFLPSVPYAENEELFIFCVSPNNQYQFAQFHTKLARFSVDLATHCVMLPPAKPAV